MTSKHARANSHRLAHTCTRTYEHTNAHTHTRTHTHTQCHPHAHRSYSLAQELGSLLRQQDGALNISGAQLGLLEMPQGGARTSPGTNSNKWTLVSIIKKPGLKSRVKKVKRQTLESDAH